MDIKPIDSKKKMLSEGDILVVAAHEAYPDEEIKASAEQHGVSPERLRFTIFAREIQNPALIRIRDGNTLFTIAGLEDRHGFVFMYNGDTENNVGENFVKFMQSAQKFGFNYLAVRCEDSSLNDAAVEVQKEFPDAQYYFEANDNLLHVKFNQMHGD